jgi:hypothetical protein
MLGIADTAAFITLRHVVTPFSRILPITPTPFHATHQISYLPHAQQYASFTLHIAVESATLISSMTLIFSVAALLSSRLSRVILHA